MNPIPLVDLSLQHAPIKDQLQLAFETCWQENSFIGGADIKAFEDAFAQYLGGGHVSSCASGTDALSLALMDVLGPSSGGDEIITPSLTFAATAEAIISAGYKPVFVDIDPSTCLMDLSHVANSITHNTRCILPVHLYGQMVDMETLNRITKNRSIKIVEDAAQAHGALWNGKPPSTLSNASCYSFFPSKNLGAFGDGGAVHSFDENLSDRIKRRGNHGRQDKFVHETVGTNSRLDALQAAILNIKLEHLPRWNRERRAAAKYYSQLLRDVDEVSILHVPGKAHHVYHLYVIRLKNRDEIKEKMRRKGIEVGVHYPIPLHSQPAFRVYADQKTSLAETEKACDEIMSLPIYPGITHEQIEYITDTLKELVHA
ncbi:DegT/DnrJ/EryC1/StrS family aminotransferase [Magnetovibrio sp. PR-2]|uniref:DegT/DnrJ/EryC1/StrS family aminotransferase n=1 Tax=Magnetovibrio sp. PR-2 TaxID=3120356 RepID=UPI002FCDECDC